METHPTLPVHIHIRITGTLFLYGSRVIGSLGTWKPRPKSFLFRSWKKNRRFGFASKVFLSATRVVFARSRTCTRFENWFFGKSSFSKVFRCLTSVKFRVHIPAGAVHRARNDTRTGWRGGGTPFTVISWRIRKRVYLLIGRTTNIRYRVSSEFWLGYFFFFCLTGGVEISGAKWTRLGRKIVKFRRKRKTELERRE